MCVPPAQGEEDLRRHCLLFVGLLFACFVLVLFLFCFCFDYCYFCVSDTNPMRINDFGALDALKSLPMTMGVRIMSVSDLCTI